MPRPTAVPAARIALAVALALACPVTARAAASEVTSPTGATLRIPGPEGKWLAERLPPVAADAAALAGSEVERRESTNPESGATIDADGEIVGGAPSARTLSALAAAERATIDVMNTRSTYYETYQPAAGLPLFTSASTYELSDGSSWASGAGVFTRTSGWRSSVTTVGNVIRFTLSPPVDGVLYRQVDYDYGDHSAQGTLGVSGALVLEAVQGAATAVLRGEAELLSNDSTSYGDRFNYYSAPVGTFVPFEITYTLVGSTWSRTTLDADFGFTSEGRVDFTAARFLPLVGLELRGSGKVPPDSLVPYFAVAVYENGAREDVSDAAVWTVAPNDAARVSAGQIETRACDGVELTLRASFTRDGVTRSVQKKVACSASASSDLTDVWETFQGDPRHSGYVPVRVEPASFTLRWQRIVGSGAPLNPVTAADGKVFVSLRLGFRDETGLFVLDERDGETIWSKGFGPVYSVNPPAFGYGNVYIQTGNHNDDTYLWAFDANTGAKLFQSHHQAQWEYYFAPTVFDDGVYVDGGTYGGMYAFSAFSGAESWFTQLQQYDAWTPAVDALSTYSYQGAYSPGLYVLDRLTGGSRFQIPDPDFVWNGWSMGLAPVLGELNDVLVIHGGRLIRFDLQQRKIAWQSKRAFAGQPSVAKGVIYAIDGASLVALDEATGAPLWSWAPRAGQLAGTLVVTDSHVLASTADATYAVDLTSHLDVWSYPAAGQLALGRDTLFVAADDGTLTAIGMRELTDAALGRIEISGPDRVTEGTTPAYTAYAFYADGQVRDRTSVCDWSVAPDLRASIDGGRLSVDELVAPIENVTVSARYSEAGLTLDASLPVELVIGVPLDEFAKRNLLAARALKEHALGDLDAAAGREREARAILDDDHSKVGIGLLKRLRAAMSWSTKGTNSIERSVQELDGAIGGLDD